MLESGFESKAVEFSGKVKGQTLESESRKQWIQVQVHMKMNEQVNTHTHTIFGVLCGHQIIQVKLGSVLGILSLVNKRIQKWTQMEACRQFYSV